MRIFIILISLFILFTSPVHAYRIGVDYHATTDNFAGSAFISQYHDPAVRSKVIAQVQDMANQGISLISTRLWLIDPPSARFPASKERLGFPPTTQEITNLTQYVRDVTGIKNNAGQYLDFYLTPLTNGCAELVNAYPACMYTWEQRINIYKQSYRDIFAAVGNLTRPDGKKAVTIIYMTGELMVNAHQDLDKFVIQVYPYFVSLAQQYGLTPSIYFIITPEESSILDDNYVDATYPVLNKHKSLYWLHRDLEFLRQNNLPIPARIDFSLYPHVVNSNYDTLIKRVFDDLSAVYPGRIFGAAETFYPTTTSKRRELGQALFAESIRRNLLQEASFWTTPNSGEKGENAGYPYEIAAYLPPKKDTLPVLTLSPLQSDLNKDGHVDGADYTLFIAGFGTKYTILDYSAIMANYGK